MWEMLTEAFDFAAVLLMATLFSFVVVCGVIVIVLDNAWWPL